MTQNSPPHTIIIFGFCIAIQRCWRHEITIEGLGEGGTLAIVAGTNALLVVAAVHRTGAQLGERLVLHQQRVVAWRVRAVEARVRRRRRWLRIIHVRFLVALLVANAHMGDIVEDGSIHHELHGRNDSVVLRSPVDDQRIGHIRIEHDSVGSDEQHATDDTLAVGDVPHIDLEEPLCDDRILVLGHMLRCHSLDVTRFRGARPQAL